MNRRRFLQAFTSIGLTGPGSMVGWQALRHDLVAAVGGDVADIADIAEWDAPSARQLTSRIGHGTG